MKSTTGFSLLELLIVMAIIAVLIQIAYPAYTVHLVKSRRNQAEISLLHLASQLEVFYSLHDSYQGATVEALGISTYTDDHSYQLTIQSASDSDYKLAAVPVGQQAKYDNICGTLLLDASGSRVASGTADPTSCWS